MNKTKTLALSIAVISVIPFFVMGQSPVDDASTSANPSDTVVTAVDLSASANSSTPIVPAMSSSDCPLNISFMKLGNPSNSAADVMKLQKFLKDYEQADVDVNGMFDEKTDAAVRTFQRKYMDTIMAPWGATRPSGIVNITTQKKINEIACQTPLSLDAAELGVIADYTSNQGSIGSTVASQGSPASSQSTNQSSESPNGPSVVVVPPQQSQSPTAPPVSESSPSASPSDNSGASLNANVIESGPQIQDEGSTTASTTSGGSLAQRFWEFLKKIF